MRRGQGAHIRCLDTDAAFSETEFLDFTTCQYLATIHSGLAKWDWLRISSVALEESPDGPSWLQYSLGYGAAHAHIYVGARDWEQKKALWSFDGEGLSKA
jgi:hypothetical protein